MHHNDLARDGVYLDSTNTLTREAVASLEIDPSFANATVAANVYAQPLYLTGTGAVPDLVIVAAEDDSVSAFNATNGALVWRRSLGTPVSTGLPCGAISPLGITGTPVIDPQTRTIYLDAMTADATATAKHLVHALDADTGAEQKGWPAAGVDLNASASSGGTTFESLVQNQKAALALVNGEVFIPYSGHVGDCGGYHGWVVGVSTSSVAAGSGTPTVTAWATHAVAGGIWGASGIASDGSSLFFATGNSKSSAAAGGNTSSGDANASNWGDSETVFKFPTSLAEPAMATSTDYFVPANWVALDDADGDLGGTGPVLIDVAGTQLVVALGKDANAYLLDRSNLGGYGAKPLGILKASFGGIVNAAVAYTSASGSYVVFAGLGNGCPSGQSGSLTAIKIAPATAGSPPTMSIGWCGGPASTRSPSVSQTDPHGSNTIVWTVGSDNKLYAVDGDTGQTLFAGGATAMSPVQSIQVPIVAKGRVLVASNTRIYAYRVPPTDGGAQ